MKKPSNEIIIGLPSNSRMRKDLEPYEQALEIKRDGIRFTSPLIRGASFRGNPVADIARCLIAGVYQLGILGDDTAIENNLEKVEDQLGLPVSLAKDLVIRPADKVFDFPVGETCMTLLVKPEMLKGITELYELLQSGYIATSYPNLARKIFSRKYKTFPLIYPLTGQVENFVANNDRGDIVGGYDIVRSGETAKKAGLVPYLPTLISRPGLWKTPQAANSDKEKLGDTIDLIIEIFRQRMGQ